MKGMNYEFARRFRRTVGIGCCVWAVAAAGLLGCARTHKPVTQMSYGWTGFRFYDSKDNDIVWDELSIDPKTRAVKVTGFVLRNNASDPINAFVKQMEQQILYQKQLGDNMDKVLSGLSTIAGQLSAPGLTGQSAQRASPNNCPPPIIIEGSDDGNTNGQN